ncbi:MAG: murein L,D-transpeptidase catalytic domain family protein [Chlorobium sp.]|uniref:murein L,D-transpeptidase catalytic domain family protein n=1 Tax=Chlorobium sp. TaxID=1095 RepID=UPI001D982DF0|nr:murein L,D-transpeptidase catalytic domain family protein [Chlorobium sp.]MBN1278923.1 murein L,D-transpeptidase catalytic domain family protein [Chlorobiaceae bacterium]MCF8215322.1 murein L,D-transpeptidase catalytic domain family protein [Chlorobium sp.]MCF8270159.1 murein L,D-transpeptidase catalytic domain family protein [Chlorobium sp.]MCF8286529.1 murein L,D-transpeptidase catalytic domain family protein [Chlorobium sp.]MCF8290127.1 murein L,D-transpeptidase catalytic domain family p
MTRKRTTRTVAFFLLLVTVTGTLFINIPEKISQKAYRASLVALDAYRSLHPEKDVRMLAVVDYSKPSYLKRMALIDLKTGNQTFYRIAHGKQSGELYARHFSDMPESNTSSLGLFKVLGIYDGDHGTALRLEGLEPGRNGNAFRRDIVLHSADYVSLHYIFLNLVTFEGPRIGRSNGCFVVSQNDIREVTEKLAEGGLIYAWAE